MKFVALLCGLTMAAQAAPLTLHVATNGNDTASGAANAPFASLPAAIHAARQQRSRNQAATILLHNGRFALNDPVKLTPADSGLTIAAADDAKSIISGGRSIAGWKIVRSNLWQAATGDRPDGRGQYFRQLFIDGHRATVARTPNEGSFFRMDGARFSDTPASFRFKAGDIKPAWTNDSILEVVGLEKWSVFRQHLRNVISGSNVVQLSGNAAPHTREPGAQYYIENTADALDAAGEWHIDYQKEIVSYLARPGEDLSKAEVIAPMLEELLLIEGDVNKPVE